MADVLELLASDHQRVSDLFGEIGQTSDPARRRAIVNDLIRELSIHASIEEEVFYPAIAERVTEGSGFVKVSLEEHEKAKLQLKKLDGLSPEDPLFDPGVGELSKEIKEHVADEEMQLFPRVRAAFDARELEELGASVARRREKMPTRPHPKGPAKAPLNVAANRASAPLDRARDARRGGSGKASSG